MKRAAVAGIILLVLLVVVLTLLFLFWQVNNTLQQQLADLTDAVRANQSAESLNLLKTLSQEWWRAQSLTMPLLGKRHVEPVNLLLARASVCLSQGETSDLLCELAELEALLDHMWRGELPLFENLL